MTTEQEAVLTAEQEQAIIERRERIESDWMVTPESPSELNTVYGPRWGGVRRAVCLDWPDANFLVHAPGDIDAYRRSHSALRQQLTQAQTERADALDQVAGERRQADTLRTKCEALTAERDAARAQNAELRGVLKDVATRLGALRFIAADAPVKDLSAVEKAVRDTRNKLTAALSSTPADAQERVRRLEEENARLWTAMKSIRRNDASAVYESRGPLARRRLDGAKPPAGQRWLTPREIADDLLRNRARADVNKGGNAGR